MTCARAIILAVLLVANVALAEDWPQFRGPAAGISQAKNVPTKWSANQNVVGRRRFPGRGGHRRAGG